MLTTTFFPDKLAAQMAVFAARPNLGIVHSGWRLVNSIGEPLKDVHPWQNVPKLDLEMWLRWKPVLPSAMVFRRQWLQRAADLILDFPRRKIQI